MATKKRIVKFICPKCHATAKAFAEPDEDPKKKNKQTKECFRCGARMTPMAEDLEKAPESESPEGKAKDAQTPDGQSSNDQNQIDAQGPGDVNSTEVGAASNKGVEESNGPDTVVEPTTTPLPPVQTTTHEVASENYGVVVTDTNFNVGSVEVNTIRIEDHIPPEESKATETPQTDSPKAPPAAKAPEETPDTAPEQNDSRSNTDIVEDGTKGEVQVEESINGPVKEVVATPKADSADEYKLQDSSPNPESIAKKVSSAEISEDALDGEDVSTVDESPKSNASEAPTPSNAEDTNQEELAPQVASEENQSDGESTPAAETKPKRLIHDPSLIDKENLLKFHYANENAWFADAMHFIQSAEFVLRWLLIGLLTGLGLYLVIGAFAVASFLGYIVAIPGLVLLGVAGADICTETIAGCRKIEKWTSWEVDKILSQSLIVVLSFAFAVIPGVLISIPFILSVENYVLTTILASISFLLLFPAFMMSILDNESISQPFSGKVFGSMREKIVDWMRFLGLSLVCLLFVAGFGFFSMFGGNFLFCLIEALGIGFVSLCYFRFIGFQYRKLFLTEEKKNSEND